MSYTNTGLVAYAKSALEAQTVYAWGGLMRKASNNYINQLKSMYPSYYGTDRVNYLKSLIGKAYMCDCVGLIKSYYFGGFTSPYYDGSKDISTKGFYDRAPERGDIGSMPEIPGLITYMDGHVGVYIGNGEVIECTLGDYGDGVVKTTLKGRGWTHWLKSPYIDYVPQPETPAVTSNCDTNCPYCEQGWYPYTVQSGDSFWKIAAEQLGNGALYSELCEYNKLSINAVIHPGDTLKIPIKEK